MRRRWALTIVAAIVLVVAIRVGIGALNGPSSAPPSLLGPGTSGGAGDVQSKAHCESMLTVGLRSAIRSLSASERRALPRTIAAVCGNLPGGTQLQVAAQEVLTIVRNRGR